MAEWVVEKLDEWRTRRRPRTTAHRRWRTRLSFLGDEIEIGIAIGANRAIWAPGRLTLCMKPGLPRPGAGKGLARTGREHFASRLAPLLPVIGVSVPALALVVGTHALGQLQHEERHPPQLAPDPFPRGHHRLRRQVQ